jgi:TetR/AcrR family transcriptional regulator, transcriptional repressor for nem operon
MTEVAMARGDLTREKILQAAGALFHEFGYNGTSVQDIVRKAGVPKGSFYNYFKSKEELAIAASDVFYPYALAFLDLQNTSSPVTRLRKYFQLTLKEMQRYEYVRGCLVGNFASEITNATPALKKRVTEHLDEATRRIAVVISQAQEMGEMDPEVSTMDLSRFILNSLYGAIFRSKTDRTERPMKLLQKFALDPFVIKKR